MVLVAGSGKLVFPRIQNRLLPQHCTILRTPIDAGLSKLCLDASDHVRQTCVRGAVSDRWIFLEESAQNIVVTNVGEFADPTLSFIPSILYFFHGCSFQAHLLGH